MKKIVLFFILFCTTTLFANAIPAIESNNPPPTFTVDNITYLPISGTEVSVTGNTITTPSDITIPSTVSDGGITYSVTSIGNSAFSLCTSLKSITIPNTVTSIGHYAFYQCTSLTSIAIPNSVTSIGYWVFTQCSTLTSITIPNSVTSIGWATFVGCIGLTSITLPSSVTTIEDYTFYGCSGLTSITLPASLINIGINAFAGGCIGLTSITLPSGVTSIGDGAFDACSGLTSFTINAVTPPSINSSVFNAVPVGPVNLYVPAGSKTAYKSASVWSGFKFGPTITGPGSSTGSTSTLSMDENSTAVTTFTSDEDVIWSLGSSNDSALFSINSSSGVLVFNAAPDYESPSDNLQNNTYIVDVIATDINSVTSSQQLTITITDVVETVTLDNAGLSSSTPASGAYSFRLLGSLYSGPLARITIGSAYYDVYPDATSIHNFSLSSPISAAYSNYNDVATGATSNLLSSIVSSTTSATVAIWYDQSGNGKNPTQAVTASQPRIIDNGSIDVNNGGVAMTFQNFDQGLSYSGSITVQTVNTVRSVADLSFQTLFCIPANADFSVRNDGGNSFYNLNPNGDDWSYNTSPNYTYVNRVLGAAYNRVNKVHTAFIGSETPKTGTFSISQININTNRGMSNGTAVNELLLFPAGISDADRVLVENSQYTAFNIPLPPAVTIWNGSSITFQKANNADYTLPVNQDFLTNNVKITRGNYQGLINIAAEGGYNLSSPSDTEWAQGTLSDFATLNYQNWRSAFQGNPPAQVGHTFVVHLITDNIYFQLTLLSWSQSNGGFSYSRTTPPCSAPSAPTASSQSFNNAATVAELMATGTAIQWYSASTGGNALSSSTALVSGTYYASQTVNSCESSRTSVAVTILIPTVLSNFDSFTVSSSTSDFTINPPTSNSTGAITYTSSNPAVATIIGTTVHLVGPGTTTITATQAADGSYIENSISTTMKVSALCGDWGYSLTYPNLLTISGAVWTSSTTGTLNGVSFTLTNINSTGQSPWDLTASQFSVAPLSATQSMVEYEIGDNWTVTFASPITNLKLYCKWWRDADYTFNQTFSILSGATGLSNVGNTLTVSGGWGNGILEFTGPITTLTVIPNQIGGSGQIMTFGN